MIWSRKCILRGFLLAHTEITFSYYAIVVLNIINVDRFNQSTLVNSYCQI